MAEKITVNGIKDDGERGGIELDLIDGSIKGYTSGFGMIGIAHNRNIAAAATTVPVDRSNNYASFTAAEQVRELTVNAVGSVGGAVANDDAYLVVINAPTASIAKAWLDDAGAANQDIIYEIGYVGVPLVISRTTNILHVDVKPLSEVMRFGISGVGVES